MYFTVRMLDFTLSIYNLPLDCRAEQPRALRDSGTLIYLGGSNIPWFGFRASKGFSSIQSTASFPNEASPSLDNKPQRTKELINTNDTRGRPSQALISVITMITTAPSTALTLSRRSPVKDNAWSFPAGTRALSTKLIAPIIESLCIK
ncbi:hypothetical protein PCH_Pc22g20880 [Penicillium rubens Wisconsin 54-1255]|uniref:Uncharacterized protein n=1 Tax=Penicillium rubens (strain ATCC 28089 / DSM 1075 / NRRL 1951 / Wisconsin 54-1255) TaxID=500485 RepID=B6HRM3_PENRW|nr:hypothetical protein PCH_Pc22g20880 [Penicillium rubens Wisconsin 54-1255]